MIKKFTTCTLLIIIHPGIYLAPIPDFMKIGCSPNLLNPYSPWDFKYPSSTWGVYILPLVTKKFIYKTVIFCLWCESTSKILVKDVLSLKAPHSPKNGKNFNFILEQKGVFFLDITVCQQFLQLTYTCNFALKGLKASKIWKRKLPDNFVELEATVFEL